MAFEVTDLQTAVDRVARDGFGLVGGIGEYEGTWKMAYVRGVIGPGFRSPDDRSVLLRAQDAARNARDPHPAVPLEGADVRDDCRGDPLPGG